MKSAIVLFDFKLDLNAQARTILFETEKLDTAIDIIVFSEDCQNKELLALPCQRIINVHIKGFSVANYNAITIATTLEELNKRYEYDIILFPQNVVEDEVATRLGCILDATTLLNIESIGKKDSGFVVKKSVFDYNLKADILVESPTCIFTVSRDLTSLWEETACTNPEYIEIALEDTAPLAFANVVISPVADKNIYNNAKIIIVAGRGVGGKINAQSLKDLVERLGGELGGSRPTTIEGWLESYRLIGVSGTVISPDICITFGVSGSMPLAEGIKGSKTIISINNDATASIFKSSDVGIVHDYSEILDALLQYADILAKE